MKNLFLLSAAVLVSAAVTGCTCCDTCETITPCASPSAEGPALVYDGGRPHHHKHHRHHAHKHHKHHKHHAKHHAAPCDHPAHKAGPKGDGMAPGGGS